MPKKTFIYPYNPGSRSVRALATALNAIVIKPTGRVRRAFSRNHVINWGWAGKSHTERGVVITINRPEEVANARNKLTCFQTLQDVESVAIPKFATTREEVEEWNDERNIKQIVCRSVLTGHSGEGITIVDKGDPLPDGNPLYVAYIPKKREVRIHVMGGEVIDIQEKKRRREVADEDVNWRVRNHENGFIYARDNVDVPHAASDMAIDAVQALRLHFGAVDLIWNESRNQWYVLEINTAPGLEGSTVENYSNAFKRIYLTND